MHVSKQRGPLASVQPPMMSPCHKESRWLKAEASCVLTHDDFAPLQKHEMCSLADSSPWRASQSWLDQPQWAPAVIIKNSCGIYRPLTTM